MVGVHDDETVGKGALLTFAAGGIRSSEEDELVGLDLPEMGVLAYPEFGGHGGVASGSGTVGASVRERTPV